MSTPFDEIAARVIAYKSRKPASGFARAMTCTCPAHHDKRPSLEVSEKEDGRVLLHCWAGCSFEEIRQGLGMEAIELIPEHLRYNAGKTHKHGHKGPRFSAWQALEAISVDATIVVLSAAEIRRNGWLDDQDLTSLIAAEGRIQSTLLAGGFIK